MRAWKVRSAGALSLVALAWYVPWLLTRLNWRAPWLSLPFAGAALLMSAMILITVINHWSSSRVPLPVPAKEPLPDVAVVIPTYGEPVRMLEATARSVLDQEYPQNRLHVVISDDGHRSAVRELVESLAVNYPQAAIVYNEPPLRGDTQRRGDAKAGNLNAALALIQSWDNPPPYVETRDADDLVGDSGFLSYAIGQLSSDPDLAFTQSIKEAGVSEGDPFGNLEPLFYRNALRSRHAANAVFPCGSGLVWRREALESIGGFPTWNLVEDLQSGVEALRRGWRGAYLPVVGASGQTAPEDLANAIKQRGTWALDTMRLTFWGDKRGLNLRQHLHFAELGLFYILSFAVLVFAVTPIFSLLFDIYPIVTTNAQYALHFWPLAAAIELLLIALADGLPYETLWRARQTWLGMAPVYAWATLIAIWYGPNRMPSYRVTRKVHVYRWYWQEAAPQMLVVFALTAASIYHLATRPLLQTADLGSLFWSAFFVLGLSRTVINSWHGLGPIAALVERLRQRRRRPRRPRAGRAPSPVSRTDRAAQR